MTLDEQAASLDRESIVKLLSSHQQLKTSFKKTSASLAEQSAKNAELNRLLAWYKNQLFGKKSERRMVDADGRQLTLGELREDEPSDSDDGVVIGTHRRKRGKPPWDKASESGLRFDASVPVEEVRVSNPDLPTSLGASEVISEKTTYRLAQRPASYVILKYIRQVVKQKATGNLTCPPAPASVLGKSFADVSLLAGMAIDKFKFHLPLYRQHQRMEAAGIKLVRTPYQAPNDNAYAEWFVRSIREECLSRMILVGEGHLRRVVDEYLVHYNRERNHQGIEKELIGGHVPVGAGSVECRDRLGGLLKFYPRAA